MLIFALMLTWILQRLVQRYYPKLYLWQPRQILVLLPFRLVFCCMSLLSVLKFQQLEPLLTVIVASVFYFISARDSTFALLVYSASLY